MFLNHSFEKDTYGEIYPLMGVPISDPCSALSAALSGHPSIPNPLNSYPIEAVRSALRLIDQAREALGTRTDARATSARELLEAKRAPFVIGIETYESLGGFALDGPLALEILARIARVRAETKAAEQAYADATREDVLARRDALEFAKADARSLHREMCELRNALRVPKFDPTPFENSRTATAALVARPAKRPNANDQFAALQQGRVATDTAEVILWACWEPTEPHALLTLRWESYSTRETGT